MCGTSSHEKRIPSVAEVEYLNALVRGIYAKTDLPKGTEISKENFSKYFHLAIPLLKESCCKKKSNRKDSDSITKLVPSTCDEPPAYIRTVF
jgi:hypothetical protein